MTLISSKQIGVLGFLFYLFTSILLFKLVQNVQPTPYIDEVFHVPQAVKICNFTFNEWDPKITTLPGLYVASFIMYGLTGIPCTVQSLRFMNVIISIINYVLVYKIITTTSIVRKIPKKRVFVTWNTLNVSFFPVMYFFSFLYYTESLSTCLVLSAYLMTLQNKHLKSSFFGFLSVIVRQTNIVWVGFMMLYHIMSSPDIPRSYRFLRIYYREGKTRAYDYIKTKDGISERMEYLIVNVLGHFFVCLIFLVFIVYNKGIVVGDRSAHTAVFHLCQLFYFSLFVLVFKPSFWLEHFNNFTTLLRKYLFPSILLSALLSLVISATSMVHPYLLADNRHYSFYVWKRLYQSSVYAPHFLVPVYMFGLFSIEASIGEYPWKYGYYVALAMNLVPQKLFEFRYFILPFVFIRLQTLKDKMWHLVLESVFIILVNVAVFYIFATKEFYWSDLEEPQRISW